MYDRYSYINQREGMLRFPTWIHTSSSTEWIKQWVDAIKESGDIESLGIRFYGDITPNILMGWKGGHGTCCVL